MMINGLANPVSRPARWLAGPLALLLGIVIAGCSSPPGVLFDPANASMVWPAAPDTPRIRYVGQLRSDRDLAAPRTGLQGLGDAIFGRNEVQGLVNPMAACTDGADRVFVADSGTQAVQVLDLKSRKHSVWRPTDATLRLLQPVGITYDPSGRVLVADSQAAHIVAFDLEGRVTGTLGRGSLRRPCGVCVDSAHGRIIVADAAAHQVVVLSPSGDEIARIGERGGGLGQFNYPTNVTVDRNGQLIVSDSLNFRLQVFDADLRPVRSIGRKGDMPGYFAQPKGVALDSEGHIYVVDAHFEAVQLFDLEGRLLMTFGREGHGPGEFWLPTSIWIDRNDRIWIGDSRNRRVQVFDYLPEGSKP